MEASDKNGTTYPYRITVALTLEQAKRVEEAARLAGLKPGVYVRHVITGQPMPEPPRAMVDMEAARTLQGIGSNLNQIAKIGWREGWDIPMLAVVRQAILDCAGFLRKLIGLPPLSMGELAHMHPCPVVVERIEVKAPSAVGQPQGPQPKLGF